MSLPSPLLFLVIFFSLLSSAAEPQWLEINSQVPVYSRPQLDTPALYLEAGDTVPMSRKLYGDGRFYRVIVDFRGRKRGGYILVTDVDPVVKAPEFTRKEENPQRRSGWGVAVSPQIFKQGSGEPESTRGVVFQISELSGGVWGGGFYLDYPVEETWNVRVALSYRQFQIEGNAKQAETTTSAEDFDKDLTMLSLGLIFRVFQSRRGRFWYGGGFELGKVLSSKLTFASGSSAESEAGDIPLKMILTGGFGYDLPLGKTWQIVPEISAGAIANDEPISYLLQAQLSLRKAF